jgi:hypothetical protein
VGSVDCYTWRMIRGFLILVSVFMFIDGLARGDSNTARTNCYKAYYAMRNAKCEQLPALVEALRKTGDIPADGAACIKANKTYDVLSEKYFACARAGTSEKDSCLSLCKNILKHVAIQCNEISRKASSIRFDTIRAPSCDEKSADKSTSDYVDPRPVHPVRNDKPGFVPIESLETKPEIKPEAKPAQ